MTDCNLDLTTRGQKLFSKRELYSRSRVNPNKTLNISKLESENSPIKTLSFCGLPLVNLKTRPLKVEVKCHFTIKKRIIINIRNNQKSINEINKQNELADKDMIPQTNNRVKYSNMYKGWERNENNDININIVSKLKDTLETNKKCLDNKYKSIKEDNLFKFKLSQSCRSKIERKNALFYFVKEKNPIQQINKPNFPSLMHDHNFLHSVFKENMNKLELLINKK